MTSPGAPGDSPLPVTSSGAPAESPVPSDTQLNLFSPEPRFLSSPDLSRQLQEVLDEKIKSIQSSRNQLYDFSELELSPFRYRTSSTANLSNSERLFSPPVEETVHGHTLPHGASLQYSPSPRPHRAYTPRPSDHQLTFLSPPGSDSCSSGRKLGPVNVARYSDNQASPVSERRSAGRTSRRSSGHSDPSEPSDVNERTSVAVSEPQFRDLSLSESDPVYSPPSRSSISDGRYSVVFSPPSEANFSFSLPTDKKYGAALSPPTISESSDHTAGHGTVTPVRDGGGLSPTSEENITTPPPTRDKRYYTVIQDPQPQPQVPSPTPPPPPLRSARDKRLSYFLAIEQGESKGN